MNTIDFQFYLQIPKVHPAQNLNSILLLDEIGENPKPNKWQKEWEEKEKLQNKNVDKKLKNEHEEKWNRRTETLWKWFYNNFKATWIFLFFDIHMYVLYVLFVVDLNSTFFVPFRSLPISFHLRFEFPLRFRSLEQCWIQFRREEK